MYNFGVLFTWNCPWKFDENWHFIQCNYIPGHQIYKFCPNLHDIADVIYANLIVINADGPLWWESVENKYFLCYYPEQAVEKRSFRWFDTQWRSSESII